ncbi:MAG: hypothetical protein AB7N76_20465 [Planctomycetota bacterium]
MLRTYLVDAFNLLHAAGDLPGAGRTRATRALIARTVAWLRPQARPPRVVLVFDGSRPADVPAAPPLPGLELRWAPDADQDLLGLLERRGAFVVVSGDGELVARARELGHEVLAPRAFEDELALDAAARAERALREPQLSPGEVDAWVEAFGGAPRPRPAPAPPPEPVLPPDEVARWLDYFGGELTD